MLRIVVLTIFAALLLPGEETNPKGYKTPSLRKGKLVDLAKSDRNRQIEGEETVESTYLDPDSKERFRTYSVQNNIFRYDLGVKGDSAKTSLLDRDGDGLFETRLPFDEADGGIPEWILKMTSSPRRLLNQRRIPVMNDPRIFQKTAFQRGQEGMARPVVALFFVEETKPPGKEAQVNPSVALAVVMDEIKKEYEKQIFCIAFQFEPRPKRELQEDVKEFDRTVGSKVKKVPAFGFLTVHKGIDRKTKQQVNYLKFRRRVGVKITERSEMLEFRERLSKAIREFLGKQD